MGASCVGEDLLRKFPAFFRFELHIASRSGFAVVFVYVDMANFNGFDIGFGFFGTDKLAMAFFLADWTRFVLGQTIFFWFPVRVCRVDEKTWCSTTKFTFLRRSGRVVLLRIVIFRFVPACVELFLFISRLDFVRVDLLAKCRLLDVGGCVIGFSLCNESI